MKDFLLKAIEEEQLAKTYLEFARRRLTYLPRSLTPDEEDQLQTLSGLINRTKSLLEDCRTVYEMQLRLPPRPNRFFRFDSNSKSLVEVDGVEDENLQRDLGRD